MPSWLVLLLAALLSLTPVVALAAPVPETPAMMDASCMMSGDHHACLTMGCVSAGGCFVLPMVGAVSGPVVPRRVVFAPPVVALRVGWNHAPEPPPPRPGVA